MAGVGVVRFIDSFYLHCCLSYYTTTFAIPTLKLMLYCFECSTILITYYYPNQWFNTFFVRLAFVMMFLTRFGEDRFGAHLLP
jgi:hypothetical protein